MKRLILLLIGLTLLQSGWSQDQAPLPKGLDWVPNTDDLKAGAIWVPENHDAPEGNKIRITYLIIKSKNKIAPHYPVRRTWRK